MKDEVLKKKPRSTLASGGAYVVVASGASGTKQVDDRLAVLRDEAAGEGLPTEKIKVYDCVRLANWINQYPSVAARLTGFQEELFLLDDWENQEQFAGKYHATDKLAKQIEDMQHGLDFIRGEIRHLHIVGTPGVGKTRLALEIGRAPHLGKLLVYFDSFRWGIVDLLAHVRAAPAAWLLAVVDEASPDAIRQLHEQVVVADGQLRLITIGTAPPSDSTGISQVQVSPLLRNEMSSVVSDYSPHLPREHIDFVIRLADGYVKLARLVCDSLAREPDLKALEMLRQAGDMTRLLDRLLGDISDQDRQSLHVLGLLRLVGWSDDRENEGQVVAEHLGLDWTNVKRSVYGINKKTGIAPQAGRLRYISPYPLALYFALEAMEIYRQMTPMSHLPCLRSLCPAHTWGRLLTIGRAKLFYYKAFPEKRNCRVYADGLCKRPSCFVKWRNGTKFGMPKENCFFDLPKHAASLGPCGMQNNYRFMPTVITVLFTISTKWPRSAATCWSTSSKRKDGRGVAATKEVRKRARYQFVTHPPGWGWLQFWC